MHSHFSLFINFQDLATLKTYRRMWNSSSQDLYFNLPESKMTREDSHLQAVAMKCTPPQSLRPLLSQHCASSGVSRASSLKLTVYKDTCRALSRELKVKFHRVESASRMNEILFSRCWYIWHRHLCGSFWGSILALTAPTSKHNVRHFALRPAV